MRKTVGHVKAVDDLNYVREGETLGLVVKAMRQLPDARSSDRRTDRRQILFKSRTLASDGKQKLVNLMDLKPEEMKLVRREISMVFQDPINSLNPRMTVSDRG
jgi:ABC-type microcin C transport system duplicated ATPase subunit YejF